MKFEIGDLVKVNDQIEKFGVIVSSPVETPNGYTVKIAFNNKVFSMYTWCIAPVRTKEIAG